MVRSVVTDSSVAGCATSTSTCEFSRDDVGPNLSIEMVDVAPLLVEGLTAALERKHWWPVGAAADDRTEPQGGQALRIALGNELDVLALLDAGYQGIFDVQDDVESLLTAIDLVTSGYVVVSPSFGTRLKHDQPVSQAAEDIIDALTPREADVLSAIATGMTHREIARQLGITTSTVSTYVARLENKTGTHGVAELTRIASAVGKAPSDSSLIDRVVSNVRQKIEG